MNTRTYIEYIDLHLGVFGEKKISEIMTPSPIDSIESSLTVTDAAKSFKSKKRTALLVLEDGRPVGIVTGNDIVRRVIAENANPATTKTSDVMSTPLIGVLPDDTVADVARILGERGIKRTIVMRKELILGIVTSTDILKAYVIEGPADLQFFKALLRTSGHHML